MRLEDRAGYRLRELFNDEELRYFLDGDSWLVDSTEGSIPLASRTGLPPPCLRVDSYGPEPDCIGCTHSANGAEWFRCNLHRSEYWKEPIRVAGHLLGCIVETRTELSAPSGATAKQASALACSARSRWRERVIQDAITALLKCQTEQDVFLVVRRASELLLGSDVVCHAYDSVVAGRISLMWSHTPAYAPKEHPGSPSHVGYVIETRATVYEPNVRSPYHTHLKFYFVDGDVSTKSALTIFLDLGGHRRGAFQILSSREDAFQEPEQKSLASILEVAAAVVRRSFETSGRAAPGDHWRETSFKILLRDPEQYALGVRRELYEALAKEAMRIFNSYNAAVRLYDETEDRFWFAASAGAGWNEETKELVVTHRNRRSVGLDAVKAGHPVYVPDYAAEQYRCYKPVFREVQSVCAVPFELDGRPAGVVSVAWGVKDGLGQLANLTQFKQLAKEFSQVLEKLAEKEGLALHNLVESLGAGEDARVFEQSIVERLRVMFDVRGCSLFLKLPRESVLRLIASTHMPSRDVAYLVGEGLVGKCALNGVPVRDEDAREWIDREGEFGPVPDQCGVLLAPLTVKNNSAGVIRLECKVGGGPFTHEEETLLAEIGRKLAKAFIGLWRAEEARDREYKLREMLAVRHADLEALTTSVAASAKRLTEATAVKLITWNSWEQGSIRGSGTLSLTVADESPEWMRLLEQNPDTRLVIDATGSSYGDPVLSLLENRQSYETVLWAPLKFDTSEDVVELRGVLLVAWEQRPNTPKLEDEFHEILEWIPRVLPAAYRMERAIHELENLRKIGLRVGVSDFRTLMKEILNACIEWSGMENGVIRLYDEERKIWIVLAISQSVEHFLPDAPTSAFLEETRTWPEPIRVFNVYEDETLLQHVASLGDGPMKKLFESLKSLVHVQILHEGKCIGFIGLGSSKWRRIPREVINYLEIHASYCALAIDLETKRKKLENERNLSAPLALLGAMLGGFLHEFRGGFQNLQNSAFGMREMADDPVYVRDVCIRMQKTLAHLTAISTDLSTMAKHQVECREQIDLDDLLGRVFKSPPRRVTANVLCEPETIVVRGNSVQVEMAFRMLFENAVDAMPNGGEIDVRSWIENDEVKVSVKDTGMGMNQETLRKCWEPHFSTKRDTQGLPVGTGLGLSVVRGIVLRHGGDIGVTSQPYQGTTFTITLPANKP